jgi:hypothetical protein
MEIIIYSLPFIISLFLLIFFKKYIVWWEYIALITLSIFFTWAFRAAFISCMETDTEYLGGYITRITHYDEWDEWITRTCTRTVHDGYDKDGKEITHEEEYDCSYRDYHPEYWAYTTNTSEWEHYFSNKAEFDRAMRDLGYPKMVFRDMHRDYYKIDGDAQDYFYDGKPEHVRAYVWTNTYTNKVLASHSIFKFEDISDEEADSLGLFRYPDIRVHDQDVVLGFQPGIVTHKYFKYINSVYGAKKQFRIYVLVFRDKPLEISEKQKSYWQGGNKNEFVLCLGYNTKKGTIDWCNPFSWCDKPELEVATKRYFREHPRMDLSKYPKWLESHLHLWKRKEFKDFDYIENELTKGQGIALLIIILIMDIVASIFFIGNEIDNEILYNDNTYASSSILFIRKRRIGLWDWCHIIIDDFSLLLGGLWLWLTLQLIRFGDSISQHEDYMRIMK